MWTSNVYVIGFQSISMSKGLSQRSALGNCPVDRGARKATIS